MAAAPTEKDLLRQMEEYYVLRLPKDKAKALRQAIRKGDALGDRFLMNLHDANRTGRCEVSCDGEKLKAKLVNLPTINEVHRVFNNKFLYKTGDIGQMIVCTGQDELSSEDEGGKGRYGPQPHSHGLSRPLKNVRKKRFRKTAQNKVDDDPEVEREVMRLLEADAMAYDVRFEVREREEVATDVAQLTDLDELPAASEIPDSGSEIAKTDMSAVDAAQDDSDDSELEGMLADSDDDDLGTLESQSQGTGAEPSPMSFAASTSDAGSPAAASPMPAIRTTLTLPSVDGAGRPPSVPAVSSPLSRAAPSTSPTPRLAPRSLSQAMTGVNEGTATAAAPRPKLVMTFSTAASSVASPAPGTQGEPPATAAAAEPTSVDGQAPAAPPPSAPAPAPAMETAPDPSTPAADAPAAAPADDSASEAALQELASLRERAATLRAKIAAQANKRLRQRFEADLEKVEAQLKAKLG